jgi:hypothetical protein
MDGDIPQAIEDIADDIVGEVEDDFDALTSFIEGLPDLATAILTDIENDGEDVVTLIEDLVNDPGEAVTIIVDGIESVVSDISSIGSEILSGIKCLFGDCSTPASEILSSSCNDITSAAVKKRSVYIMTPTVTSTSTTPTYMPAQPASTLSAAASPTGKAIATGVRIASSSELKGRASSPGSKIDSVGLFWAGSLLCVWGVMIIL